MACSSQPIRRVPPCALPAENHARCPRRQKKNKEQKIFVSYIIRNKGSKRLSQSHTEHAHPLPGPLFSFIFFRCYSFSFSTLGSLFTCTPLSPTCSKTKRQMLPFQCSHPFAKYHSRFAMKFGAAAELALVPRQSGDKFPNNKKHTQRNQIADPLLSARKQIQKRDKKKKDQYQNIKYLHREN